MGEALAHLVAAPLSLDLHSGPVASHTISLGLNSHLAEGAPEALNFQRRDVANVANQAEPSEVFLLAPPALDTDGGLRLPDGEHLAPHEQLNAVRVELVDDFVPLLLVQRDAQLVLVDTVYLQLFLHICNLSLQFQRLLMLAHLPSLVLLLLDGLQGEGVVGERVLNVPKVGLVGDDLLAAVSFVKEAGTQHLALLVVGQIHRVVCSVPWHGLLTVIVLNIALGHVCEPLVDEAAQLEGRLVAHGGPVHDVWLNRDKLLRLGDDGLGALVSHRKRGGATASDVRSDWREVLDCARNRSIAAWSGKLRKPDRVVAGIANEVLLDGRHVWLVQHGWNRFQLAGHGRA